MVERIKKLTQSRINQIKATHATEIQKIADKEYESFLEVVGVKDDMKSLKSAHFVSEGIQERMIGVIAGLIDLHPDAQSHAYYQECNYYNKHTEFFKSCCREIAKDEFYNTEAGKELKELQKTQDNAIDTVMLDGCKIEELTVKLNNILGNSGLALLPAA